MKIGKASLVRKETQIKTTMKCHCAVGGEIINKCFAFL